MKNYFEGLEKMNALLTQALGVALHSMGGDRSVSEAKGHIKQAINKIDTVRKTQMKKKMMKETESQKWWGHIQSGTAAAAISPVSPQTHTRSLKELNAMIDAEKQKLAELEKMANQAPTTPTEILKD